MRVDSIMKTDSILETLRAKIGHDEPYSASELAEISRLNIKRFDIDKDVLRVNFDDLKYFNAVTSLTINSCVINRETIDKIKQLKTLGTLILMNCSLTNNAKYYLKQTTIKNLVIDFGEVNMDCVSDFNLDSLVINGFRIKSGLNLKATNLDVSKCILVDKNVLKSENIKKLTISYSQYMKDTLFFDNLNKEIIVMENNRELIYKELKNNG